MAKIKVLDSITVDKIAAGEVVERPASVIKELVENAIDANATAIIVEIKEGGVLLMRITDNGTGIGRDELPKAFERHATSKIRDAKDLDCITSLGFRGEALSSIASVAKVEVLSKTRGNQLGTNYLIEGGETVDLKETAAPDGTTFFVRNLFYNTPVRRKFLKSAQTEASHINDLMTRLALSHPEISFQFITNEHSKLHTSGNGKLKDVIYHIFGREVATQLLEVDFMTDFSNVKGYIGSPQISRGNRNFEHFFINGRYVKNATISKAIEDAYKDFSMTHKYPFVVLHIYLKPETFDVNVHPTKLELRFTNAQEVYALVYEAVHRSLLERELIPQVDLPSPPRPTDSIYVEKEKNEALRNDELQRVRQDKDIPGDRDLSYFLSKMRERLTEQFAKPEAKEIPPTVTVKEPQPVIEPQSIIEPQSVMEIGNYDQNTLFKPDFLSTEASLHYNLIGQLFDTYWLVEYMEQLYIIDQHAAHERVLYEEILQKQKSKTHTTQYISPPIVLNLSMSEEETLRRHMDRFTNIGFEIEEFGGSSFTISGVPDNLYSIAKTDLLIEMLDSLSDEVLRNQSSTLIDEKIASMSCKAAVKGNAKLSAKEMDELLKKLLVLENPYHCPHGRPVIISMTKKELEKKFKRIV